MKIWVLGHKGLPDGKMRSLMELPSYLINKYQWGTEYSHVSIVDPRPNNTGKIMIWEAWWDGVRYCEYDFDRVADAFYIDVPDSKVRLLVAWLDQQVGKPYDYFGLLGFLWRSNKYQNPNKWFCSELVATAFKVSHCKLYNWNIIKPHQITPALMLAALNGPLVVQEIVVQS